MIASDGAEAEGLSEIEALEAGDWEKREKR